MADLNAYSVNINLLTPEEISIVKSIIDHIEQGEKKVTVAQIAQENFVSTAFINKMCKRLGFNGYSELFYYLTQIRQKKLPADTKTSERLIENYSKEMFEKVKSIFDANRGKQVYAIGRGFEEIVAEYMAHRLTLSGFSAYTNLMFYNNTFYKDNSGHWYSNQSPSFLIAVSQSGNTREIIDNVKDARQLNYSIILFTRTDKSHLADMADVTIVVEPETQSLVGKIPNLFFGKAILAFEKLVASYLLGESPDAI